MCDVGVGSGSGYEPITEPLKVARWLECHELVSHHSRDGSVAFGVGRSGAEFGGVNLILVNSPSEAQIGVRAEVPMTGDGSFREIVVGWLPRQNLLSEAAAEAFVGPLLSAPVDYCRVPVFEASRISGLRASSTQWARMSFPFDWVC